MIHLHQKPRLSWHSRLGKHRSSLLSLEG